MSCAGPRGYISARRCCGARSGQILPGLLMVLLALLAVGMLFFQVGKAAVLATEAQTGRRRRRARAARPRSSAS